MNPDIVRWMLLMGQMDRPTTEEELIINSIISSFQWQCQKLNSFFLNASSGFPEPSQESNAHVLEESATFNLPLEKEKMDGIRFSVYGWKRLRMVFDENGAR